MIDESLTVYRQAVIGDFEEGAAAPTCEGDTDGVLTLGSLLPETGNLAYLGPPEIAGGLLAVAEINAAGGVLDNDVVWLPGDSGDNGTVANQTVDAHLAKDADVIVGAASSGYLKQFARKSQDLVKSTSHLQTHHLISQQKIQISCILELLLQTFYKVEFFLILLLQMT